MTENATIQEVLTALETQPRTLTPWEAGFLANVKRQTFPLRPLQFAKLVELAEEYLDPLLAAELRGQQRLFV
jgi:hypothetical protein